MKKLHRASFLWSFALVICILVFNISPVFARFTNQQQAEGPISFTSSIVKDIFSGFESADIQLATPFGNKLFFFANDGAHGYEPWVSDGTDAGTYQLADINPQGHALDYYLTGVRYAMPVELNGFLYFTAHDEMGRFHLWKTNGTKGHAVKVAAQTLKADFLIKLGNELFVFSGSKTWTLWKTNGDGVTKVRDFTNDSRGFGGATANGWLFFFTYGDGSSEIKLWKTNGVITEIARTFPPSMGYVPGILVAANNLVFFAPLQEPYGIELWQSDGTTTQLVQDLNPSGGMLMTSPVVVNNTLFYFGNDFVNTGGVYRTRGKSTGIEKVFDRSMMWMKNVGGTLYFDMKVDGKTPLSRMGVSPWGVPGTVQTLYSASGDYTVGDQVAWYRGWVFFSATDVDHGQELWVTDGTPTGTHLCVDIQSGAESSSPTYFYVLNGRLLFIADDGTHGAELWSLQTTGFSNIYLPLTSK